MEARYCFDVTLTARERRRLVPYAIDVDFDRLLAGHGAGGRFDRHSVEVYRVLGPRRLERCEFCLSEDFLTSGRGRVSWLIEDTEERDYLIVYDSDERGPFAPPASVGLVGCGDCLRHNDGKPHPLFVGMHGNPMAVDWDGDGRTDILSPQIYSGALGSPWFPIRFFRNEGTEESPLFGDGIPLRRRAGVELETIAAGGDMDLADWYGAGRLDLVTFPYGKARELRIYRNTGERDPNGLPVLELDQEVPLEGSGHVCSVRVVDWRGDGRRSFLLGTITTHSIDRNAPLWFSATEAEKDGAQWPRWYYTSSIDLYENTSDDPRRPCFAPPRALTTADGRPICWHAVSSFELVARSPGDAPDLLVLDNAEDCYRGMCGIRFYANVGNRSEPRFEDRGRLEGPQDRASLSFHAARLRSFDGLLVCRGATGGRIHAWSWDGRDSRGLPVLRDRGPLMQRNARLSSYAGFAQAAVADWDGDGDLDLISGCESGFVTRVANHGTRRRPVFGDPELLELDGRPLELLNGPFDDPGSFCEGPLGQTAPTLVDWDADGVLDLVVTIGRRQLYFRNTGTSSRPVYAPPSEIVADGGERVAKHRNKPAYLDWDGDGLVDVVGHDAEERGLYLFRRYRDAQTGELRLARGVPLLHADGTAVEPRSWHRYTKYFNAADWRGVGVNDIWLSTCDQILYLKNVGTKGEPRFEKPVRLHIDGAPVVVGHHVSTPLPVDWDGTGRLDLLVSGESGFFHLFRRSYLEGEHRGIGHSVGRSRAFSATPPGPGEERRSAAGTG